MLTYQVKNTRKETVTVDGLGVLPPESTTLVEEVQAESFRHMRGLTLIQAGMPEGVQVAILLQSSNDEEKVK